MDDYLFDLDQYLNLQSEEAKERAAAAEEPAAAAKERAAAAAAGPPQPEFPKWAPPALPADMVAPEGADVDAWYDEQDTDYLVVDARVRGARRLWVPFRVLGNPRCPAAMVAPCDADVEAWCDVHENAQCHLVVDALVRGAQRLCLTAQTCVHVCWQQGACCRRVRLGSGGTGGSFGWVRSKSMDLEAQNGCPRAHAPWGQGCARRVSGCKQCLTRALCRRAGGVARFFNHSCNGGNMVMLAVLAEGDSALCYRLALFASKDIPADTELTYDYKADESHPNGRVECRCGSEDCRGRLLSPLLPPADSSPSAAPMPAPIAASAPCAA